MQKSKLAGSALILVAALMGAAAYAQDAKPGMAMGEGMGFDFAALDADKDGKVTKAEVDAFHAAKVKAADTNADAKLSAEELAAMQLAAMQQRAADRAGKMIAKLDTDADGMLSEAEMAARPNAGRMFTMMDTDGDGAITQAEADAAKQAMQEHRGGKHGKGGHGKGGYGKGGQGMGGQGMGGQDMDDADDAGN